MDGATFTIVWEYRQPNHLIEQFTSWSRGEPAPDLDGDGAPDFVFTNILWPVGGVFYSNLLALSGASGSVIWQRSFPQLGAAFEKESAIIRDIDGDGVVDIFTFGSDEFAAVSGATGSVIWQVSNQILGSSLPPNMTSYYFDTFAFMVDVQGSPGDFEIVVPTRLEGSGKDQLWALTHLNPTNGQLIFLDVLPNTLTPWTDDVVHYFGHTSGFSVGDIDGDGFEEYALDVPSPTTDNPSNYLGNDDHLVFFGLKTWFVPETATVGSIIQPKLSIPSAAGATCRILISRGFDRHGGFTIDGWATHLQPTTALFHSLHSPLFRGTLDGVGETSFSLYIPNQSVLIGTTLFSVAVIEESNKPGKLKTMSTLGTTEIIP